MKRETTKTNGLMRAMGLALILSGMVACHYVPDERSIEESAPLPDAYDAEKADETAMNHLVQPWWLAFSSDELNRLENLAFEGNLSLKQAWARLRQARAAAGQAGADQWPDLSVSAGYDLNDGQSIARYDESDASATLSYALDLWGEIRASKNMSRLEAEATEADLRATALLLSANIAQEWILILEKQRVRDLLQEQIEDNRTQLELVELRFKNSQATLLDVLQQRQQMANSEGQMPAIEQALAQARYRLNTLLGRPAGVALDLRTLSLPEIKDSADLGIPSQLLENRPDVQAAFRRLESADWGLASAKANRLPSVSLSATLSTSGDPFSGIFDNWLSDLAAGLSMPLLDGGSLQMAVEKQRAVVDLRLHAFRESVLNAYREVESSLIAELKRAETLDALKRELDLAQQTLDEAQNRYLNGMVEYVNVLDARITVQKLERNWVGAKADLCRARILLHESLGGSLNLSGDEVELPGLSRQVPLIGTVKDIFNGDNKDE